MRNKETLAKKEEALSGFSTEILLLTCSYKKISAELNTPTSCATAAANHTTLSNEFTQVDADFEQAAEAAHAVGGTIENKNKVHQVTEARIIYQCQRMHFDAYIFDTSSFIGNHHRVQMFAIANNCTGIFSLSIVPKDPKKYQTIYYGKDTKRIDSNNFLSSKPKESYKSKEESWMQSCSQVDQPEQNQQPNPTKVLRGFIKPYSQFTATFDTFAQQTDLLPHYEYDQMLEQAELIKDNNTDDHTLSDVNNQQLRHTMQGIVKHFQDDDDANSLGIVFFDPEQRCFSSRFFEKLKLDGFEYKPQSKQLTP